MPEVFDSLSNPTRSPISSPTSNKRNNPLMKKPKSSQSKVHRRDLLKGVAAAGAAIAAGSYGTSTAKGASQSNLIQEENKKPGTRDWMITKSRQLPAD